MARVAPVNQEGAVIDMNLHFHVDNVHVHLPQDTAQLDRIESAITAVTSAITQLGVDMSQELDALEAEVSRNTTVDQSAITLLQGLAAQIEQLKTDPVKLQALADSMRGSSDALAAAVAANTPAAPPNP